MANLLSDWLGRTAIAELKLGIEWLRACKDEKTGIKQEKNDDGRARSARSPTRANFSGPSFELLYEDDGSNLRINVDRGRGKRSSVQIIQVLICPILNPPMFANIRTQISPVVILSDGRTSIPAKFSSNCRHEFERQHGRPIEERTQGAIIAIPKFRFVATPYGQSIHRLSLLIDTLEWQGGCLSTVFGRPQAIQDNETVTDLLGRLRSIREPPTHSSQDDSQPCASSPGNPVEVANDNELDESTLNTQVPFGTQLVQPMRRRRQGSLEIVGHTSLEPILAGNTRREVLAPTRHNILKLLNRNERAVPEPQTSRIVFASFSEQRTVAAEPAILGKEETPSIQPTIEATSPSLPDRTRGLSEEVLVQDQVASSVNEKTETTQSSSRNIVESSIEQADNIREDMAADPMECISTEVRTKQHVAQPIDVDYYTPGCDWMTVRFG